MPYGSNSVEVYKLMFWSSSLARGKNITELWKVSVKCFRCYMLLKKKVVNVVDWTTFPPHLGFFRHLGWYLQLLLWKQNEKEEQLVEGSCLL